MRSKSELTKPDNFSIIPFDTNLSNSVYSAQQSFNVFPITDSTPYGCQHFACAVCVKECIRTNNNRCSICRLE